MLYFCSLLREKSNMQNVGNSVFSERKCFDIYFLPFFPLLKMLIITLFSSALWCKVHAVKSFVIKQENIIFLIKYK